MPIKATDLVLDVGSGGNPHPAADVLLEKYLDPGHRFVPMVADRPTVLADACKMPFKDKAFDFTIASHVLEHMDDPARFLLELQRVSKAGYIEVPSVLFERLVPYDVHLLEIGERKGQLIIHKKASARPDRAISDLDLISESARWRKIFYDNPELFHVCFVWTGEIKFKILNPETSLSWFKPPSIRSQGEVIDSPRANSLRGLGLLCLRRIYRARKTGRLDLHSVLACPECHGALRAAEGRLLCEGCQVAYATERFYDFNSASSITASDRGGAHAKC